MLILPQNQSFVHINQLFIYFFLPQVGHGCHFDAFFSVALLMAIFVKPLVVKFVFIYLKLLPFSNHKTYECVLVGQQKHWIHGSTKPYSS